MNISDELLYKEIGRRLRDYRGSLFTQAELADKVGLERTSITNIERGAQKLPLHVLYKLCVALKVDVTAVLPDADEIKTVDSQISQVTLGTNSYELRPQAAQAVNSILDAVNATVK